MFTFAGRPPVDTVRLNADCSLRALGGDDIAVATLHPSSATPIAAVCSSGYLNLTEHQRIWAQSNTYIASDDTRGLLVEQSIFVGMERLSTLTDDITRLSEALRNALNQCVACPTPPRSTAAARRELRTRPAERRWLDKLTDRNPRVGRSLAAIAAFGGQILTGLVVPTYFR